MTMPVLNLVPTIMAIGVTGDVAKRAMSTKGGRPVGIAHWHYKNGKPYTHKHQGGGIAHYHRGLKGYGKTRKTLKKI